MRIDGFYVLASAIVAAMIWFAVAPGLQNQRMQDIYIAAVRERGFVVEGAALESLAAAPGTSLIYVSQSGTPFVRGRALYRRQDGAPSSGVFYTLPPSVARVYAGATIRARVTARPSAEGPASAFELAFFLANGGGSGWERRELSRSLAEYEIVWTVPDIDLERPLLIGVWPDADKDSGGVDITRIHVLPVVEAS